MEQLMPGMIYENEEGDASRRMVGPAFSPGETEKLSYGEARVFVMQCIRCGEQEKAVAAARVLIDKAVEEIGEGDAGKGRRIIADMIKIQRYQQTGTNFSEMALGLVEHENQYVARAAIESLDETAMDTGVAMLACEMLLRDEYEVRKAAMIYIEKCVTSAAVWNRETGISAIEQKHEVFLQEVLRLLKRKCEGLEERNQKRLDESGSEDQIWKRANILIALVYHELLRCIDWRREMKHGVGGIREAGLRSGFSRMGKTSIRYFFEMLHPGNKKRPKEGVEVAALKTLGMLGNEKEGGNPEEIPQWIENTYLPGRPGERQRGVAEEIFRAHRAKRPYRSTFPPAANQKRGSGQGNKFVMQGRR